MDDVEHTNASVTVTDDPATVELDMQDPLPESNFFWRRIYSYLVTCALIGLLIFVVSKMQSPESLRIAALYLSVLLWFAVTYYMVAPSAEQIVRIIQAARTLRSGVDMAGREREERSRRREAPRGRYDGPERRPSRRRGRDFEDAAPRSRYRD